MGRSSPGEKIGWLPRSLGRYPISSPGLKASKHNGEQRAVPWRGVGMLIYERGGFAPVDKLTLALQTSLPQHDWLLARSPMLWFLQEQVLVEKLCLFRDVDGERPRPIGGTVHLSCAFHIPRPQRRQRAGQVHGRGLRRRVVNCMKRNLDQHVPIGGGTGSPGAERRLLRFGTTRWSHW